MTATGAVETGKTKSQEEEKEPDLVSKCIGDYGRWQFTITFLLSLVNFPCTFHIFAPTFEAAQGEFWCAPPPRFAHMSKNEWINISHTTKISMDGKEVPNPCEIKDLDYEFANMSELIKGTNNTRSCVNWQYDMSAFGQTIVSEWDLVCEKEQYGNIAEMAFLVGVAFGGLASGLISDRFGRKTTLMISLSAQLMLGTAIAFAPWFSVYVTLRSFLGFFSVSVVFSGFVLCMEIVGGKWLTIAGVSYLFTNPLGYITISGIAYFIKGWRELQIVITLPAIFFLALGWVIPESPRWLITTRKIEKAIAVLEYAAKFNKKDLPPNFDKMIRQEIAQAESEEPPKAGIIELFRTKKMRKISLVLYVIWFSVYLVYYGLVLNLSNLGGDVYLNSIISGAVELPAIAASILILLKMGRRWPLCISTICAGIACLLTIPVPKENGWLIIGLATLGRFCISSSNVVMPVFTAELFPTIMRNLGVGSSNAPAGIALLLVPYLWNMAGMNINMPMGVLGVCGVLGGLSVLLLPETSNGLVNSAHIKAIRTK